MGIYRISTGIYGTINTCRSWLWIDKQRACLTWYEFYRWEKLRVIVLFSSCEKYHRLCVGSCTQSQRVQEACQGRLQWWFLGLLQPFHALVQLLLVACLWYYQLRLLLKHNSDTKREKSCQRSVSPPGKRQCDTPSQSPWPTKRSKEKVNSLVCVCVFLSFSPLHKKNKFLYFTIQFKHPHRGSIIISTALTLIYLFQMFCLFLRVKKKKIRVARVGVVVGAMRTWEKGDGWNKAGRNI